MVIREKVNSLLTEHITLDNFFHYHHRLLIRFSDNLTVDIRHHSNDGCPGHFTGGRTTLAGQLINTSHFAMNAGLPPL